MQTSLALRLWRNTQIRCRGIGLKAKAGARSGSLPPKPKYTLFWVNDPLSEKWHFCSERIHDHTNSRFEFKFYGYRPPERGKTMHCFADKKFAKCGFSAPICARLAEGWNFAGKRATWPYVSLGSDLPKLFPKAPIGFRLLGRPTWSADLGFTVILSVFYLLLLLLYSSAILRARCSATQPKAAARKWVRFENAYPKAGHALSLSLKLGAQKPPYIFNVFRRLSS